MRTLNNRETKFYFLYLVDSFVFHEFVMKLLKHGSFILTRYSHTANMNHVSSLYLSED